MKENADYVGRELATLELDSARRAETEKIWRDISGTGHDVASELFELDELLDGAAPEATILARFERIQRWIREALDALHEVVEARDAASKTDGEYQVVFVLVVESATNILKPFARLNETLMPAED